MPRASGPLPGAAPDTLGRRGPPRNGPDRSRWRRTAHPSGDDTTLLRPVPTPPTKEVTTDRVYNQTHCRSLGPTTGHEDGRVGRSPSSPAVSSRKSSVRSGPVYGGQVSSRVDGPGDKGTSFHPTGIPSLNPGVHPSFLRTLHPLSDVERVLCHPTPLVPGSPSGHRNLHRHRGPGTRRSRDPSRPTLSRLE